MSLLTQPNFTLLIVHEVRCFLVIGLILSIYSHESGLGKGPAYSLSGRPEARGDSEGPGPAAYTPDQPGKTGGVSMSGRYASTISSESPGPGAYL